MILGGAGMAFANEQWLINAGITEALGTVHMLGYITLVMGLAMLIVGFLLWSGKKIAWYLAVVVFIADIAMSVYNVITGAPITSVIVTIVVAAIVLFYLFTPKVKTFYSVG